MRRHLLKKIIKYAILLLVVLQIYWMATRTSSPPKDHPRIGGNGELNVPKQSEGVVEIGSNANPQSLISALNTDKTNLVHWVCITNLKKAFRYKTKNEYRWKWYLKNKELILPARECLKVLPQKKITIHGNLSLPEGIRFHQFNVSFTRKQIPDGYMVLDDRVAFFNGFNVSFPYRPYNFYHFITQDFFSLHYIIKNSNRLNSKGNDIFPASPIGFCPGKFVPFDMTMSKSFLGMLGVDNVDQSVYQDNMYPDRVCYKDAVFNSDLHLDKALDAINFIKEKLSVVDECEDENLMTIAQRDSYRKILNVGELRNIAIEMGYKEKVVMFEKLSLSQQAQLIHCTKVLVGIQGAALTWANFMKNNSGLIEIAWPKKGWHFYFTVNKGFNSQLVGMRPLNMSRISVSNCKIKPSYISMYYESMFSVKKNFSDEDAKAIINDERNYSFEKAKNHVTLIGKLCDVVVPKNAFRRAILEVQKHQITQ